MRVVITNWIYPVPVPIVIAFCARGTVSIGFVSKFLAQFKSQNVTSLSEAPFLEYKLCLQEWWTTCLELRVLSGIAPSKSIMDRMRTHACDRPVRTGIASDVGHLLSSGQYVRGGREWST